MYCWQILRYIGGKNARDLDAKGRAPLPGGPNQAVVLVHFSRLLQKHVPKIGGGFPVHAGEIIDQWSETNAREYVCGVNVKGVGSHGEMLLPVGEL